MNQSQCHDAPSLGLDQEALERWLLARRPGLSGPLRVERVGMGRSNLTFRITDALGTELILRRPRSGTSLGTSQDPIREFSILEALHAAGEKVPRPIAYCDDAAVIGARFYLMEAVGGIVLDSRANAERLDAAARQQTAASLARTLAELHAVDVKQPPFDGLSNGGGYAGRQVRRWSRQWHSARTRDLPACDRLGQRLAASIPEQEDATLVHGDFTLFNVIVNRDGEVRAVLDWEMSTLGDPIADLAWCTMWWPDTESEAAPGAEPVPLLEGFPPKREIARRYQAATSRDLRTLPWWQTLSYWKLAVILEGILKSWQEDPINGGHDPESLAPGVLRAIALGERAADRAGI